MNPWKLAPPTTKSFGIFSSHEKTLGKPNCQNSEPTKRTVSISVYKGQLISKCLFEVIVWTKIPTKNLIISALKGPGQKWSKILLVFWSKRWFHKDILKLTDLYIEAVITIPDQTKIFVIDKMLELFFSLQAKAVDRCDECYLWLFLFWDWME